MRAEKAIFLLFLRFLPSHIFYVDPSDQNLTQILTRKLRYESLWVAVKVSYRTYNGASLLIGSLTKVTFPEKCTEAYRWSQ